MTNAAFPILHALRVRGFVEPPHIAEFLGTAERDVTAELEAARAQGLAVRKEGRVQGWTLTAAGRQAHAALAEAALEPSARPAVEAADAAFLEFNTPMKALCTRWQLEGQPPGCVDELAGIHARIAPVLHGMAPVAARFPAYAARLGAALDRLRAGEADAFLRPLTGSYHDVWMELHQDLLLTLGRARGQGDGQ